MKLRFALIAIVAIGMVVWVMIAPPSTKSPDFLALCGCGLVLVILIFSSYRAAARPLHRIANGLRFIEQEDYTCRLRHTGFASADAVIDIFNEMMTRLRNERTKLLEQNELLDTIVDKSPMGIVLLDFDGNISRLNPTALNLLGLKPNDEYRIPIGQAPAVLAQMITTLERNTTHNLKAGSTDTFRCSHLSFMDRGFSRSFYLIQPLTEELHKAEKKAYEKLIRVIAHEVNNTTACLSSALDTVCQELTALPETADLVEVTQVCKDRCMEMSHFITKFADVVKIPEPQPTLTDLNQRVASCKRLMESVCAERNIQLSLRLASEPLMEMIDETLFAQVLVNIVKNAAESIGEGGQIDISTQAYPTRLCIADNGAGIDASTADKLFSPFFTTKANGQGLGLMMVRDILSRHGCHFSLRTHPDGLTRFVIEFS